jgi:hypothetical protein
MHLETELAQAEYRSQTAPLLNVLLNVLLKVLGCALPCAVTLALVFAALPSHAANTTPSDSTTAALRRFDGDWAAPAGSVRVVAHAGHLVVNGKDTGSAWTAHCVLRGVVALCRGHGLSTEGYGFAFESTMRLEAEGLRDEWRAMYFDNVELTGSDTLRRK